jgi:hypothetical protein
MENICLPLWSALTIGELEKLEKHLCNYDKNTKTIDD